MTLWRLGWPADQAQPDYDWLGTALQQLHGVDATSAPSSWEPLQWVAGGIGLLKGEPTVAEDLIRALESEVARVAAWMQGPGSRLAEAAIHGDASFGNVIVLDGHMVLTDFETSGVGPPPTTCALCATGQALRVARRVCRPADCRLWHRHRRSGSGDARPPVRARRHCCRDRPTRPCPGLPRRAEDQGREPRR